MKTILVLNVGSSSVKFTVFSYEDELIKQADGQVKNLKDSPEISLETLDKRTYKQALPISTTSKEAIRIILDLIQQYLPDSSFCMVAHRVVHGGIKYKEPIRLTPEIIEDLKKLIPLAPLHQPYNLEGVEIIDTSYPDLPQVACFDTSFHTTNSPLFYEFALDNKWTSMGVRRYGFHGLSYEWISNILKKDYPKYANGKVVVAHLGNGSSLCALKDGQSIDTTMGMSALEGLPMGTRCGSIDPGVILFMLQQLKLTPIEIQNTLYKESGLKGLSGESFDVKTLLESKDPRAAFAIDYYCLKAAKHIGMMAVSLGGLDALVFTAGIGENSPKIRSKILGHLAFLPPFSTLVIPTDEDMQIARHAMSFFNGDSEVPIISSELITGTTNLNKTQSLFSIFS